MGYDMKWHHYPPELQALHDAAFPNNTIGDRATIDKYFDEQRRLGAYFRLNIFGMSEYRRHMEERGMLWWPQDHVQPEEDVAADSGGVMPGHKFCSNDGWVVTTSEITRSLIALEAWEDRMRKLHGPEWRDPLRSDPEDAGYWDQWIRYLYVARAHGGVEVW
jgi:hypothetical protein